MTCLEFRKRSRQSNEGSRFQRSFLKPLQALLVLRTSHRDHRANRGGAMSDRRGRRKATGTLCRLGGAQSHRWLLRIGTVENLDILCDHNSLGGTRRLIPLTQVALYVEVRSDRIGAPWRATSSNRGFIALSRCSSDLALAYAMACAANMSTRISMNSYFATTAGSTGTFRSKRCWGSPPGATPGPLEAKRPGAVPAACLVPFSRRAAERPY